MKLKELNELLADVVGKALGRKAKAIEVALGLPDLQHRLSQRIAFREMFQALPPADLEVSNLVASFAYANAVATVVQQTYFTAVQTLDAIDERKRESGLNDAWEISNWEDPLPSCAAAVARSTTGCRQSDRHSTSAATADWSVRSKTSDRIEGAPDMKTKTVAAVAIVVALSLGAYWHWSPVLALRAMQSAAMSGDADAFNDRVDYPKLRESLKGQMSALFTNKLSSQPTPSDNEFAKAGAALGTMLGVAMVDKMVDAFVRPEVVMRAMQEGKVMPKKGGEAPSGSQPQKEASDEANWTSDRNGVDKYIAYVSKPGEPAENRLGLVLERSGFASWKLTEIRLPAAK